MATSKLDQLTQKRQQLNAQIQAIKSKEASQQRKEDTRRKVLIGGVVMKLIRTGEMPQDRITRMLDKHLEKHADRALFELPQSIESEEKVSRLEEEMSGA